MFVRLIMAFACIFILGSTLARADALYDQCMDEKPYGTNPEWGACGYQYVKRIDKQLNVIWKFILNSYEEHPKQAEIKKSLIEEQRAWIAYKENICNIYYSGYHGREGQVLGGPLCDAKLINDRINEFRRFYCFDDKCGFDAIADHDFTNFEQTKAVFNLVKNPPYKELSQEEKQDQAIELKKMNKALEESGYDPKKDIAYENKQFQIYLDKACKFTTYLDDDLDKEFNYEACQNALIEHRIEQLNYDTNYSEVAVKQRYTNLGILFQKDDWIFGCDQSYTCTAIGYPDIKLIYNKGQYIRIRWQYNSNEPPSIRFVVASLNNKIKDGNFSYSFDDEKDVFPLSYEKAAAPIIIDARINPKDSEAFLNTLLKDKTLTFGIDNEDLPKSKLDLFTFAEFYNAQKENAEQLYGYKVAYIPTLSAIPFSIEEITINEDENPSAATCNINIKNLGFQINTHNGQVFIASCNGLGDRNNTAYRLQQKSATQQELSKQENAKFDSKVNWHGTISLYNLVKGNKLLKLHSFNRFSYNNNDCGYDYDYVYDGKKWRLSSYRSMPNCALIPREDWPILYNTQLQEKK